MQERQETWVPSLGREYPLEKEITNHSNMLACRIPWTEEHCGLQSMGSQKAGCDWSHSAWHTTWENTPLPWLVLGVTNQVNAGTIPYFAWSVTNQAPGAGHGKYKRKPNGKKRTKGEEYRSQVVESMVQGLIFERKKKKSSGKIIHNRCTKLIISWCIFELVGLFKIIHGRGTRTYCVQNNLMFLEAKIISLSIF